MNKINKLKIENFMRIRVAEIEPNGSIVTVTGRNGQGKSSVLDAIAAVFGGPDKKNTPMPIRDGETSAHIIAETDDYVITRRYTKSKSTVEIATHDGAKFPKAQAKLDSLLGKLTFDPLEFTRLDDKKQLETLLGLVDLPFDPQELEQQRTDLYEQRAEVGRQGKAIGTVEVDESLPKDEQSASEIIQQIREVQRQNDEISKQQSIIDSCMHERTTVLDQIEQLKAQLTQIDDRHETATQTLHELGEPKPTNELEAQLATVEETNAKIRANNNARARRAERERLREEWETYSSEITALDKSKAAGLAQAEMPVEGLGFDDHGVTYQGIPFKQVNPGSDIIISASIGMALNPDVRVMRIKEGSLLDTDSMRELAKLAEKHDYQIWVEVVSDGDGPGIVIEDGSVKGDD